MSPTSSGWRPPRTLIIGAGAAGQQVVQAAHKRFADRSNPSSPVAWLAVVAADVGAEVRLEQLATAAAFPPRVEQRPATPPTPVITVTLPLDGPPCTRRAARQAALTAGGATVAAVVDALARISRIHAPAPFPLASRRPQMLSEIACFLVTALDDPFGGALAFDLAYLARHLARQRLNASMSITGILLLPDSLSGDDPQAAQARAYAALCELETIMRPHDGWPATWADGLQVAGWGPVFDRGCFLLSSLNNQGLSLADGRERVEMTGEALLQLALEPLGTRCDSPLPPEWNAGERGQVFSSLGVAAWVYPCQAMIEAAALRMAQVILEAWLRPAAQDLEAQAASSGMAWLESEHLDPAAVSEDLMSGQQFTADGLRRPVSVPLSIASVRAMRQALDALMADRVAPLAATRPEMDHQAKALGLVLANRIAASVNSRLDLPAASRLDEAAVFLAAARARLEQVLSEAAKRALTQQRALESIEHDLARIGQQLDEIGGCFPVPEWRSVLSTMLSPRRVWIAARAVGRLRELAPAYGALLTRRAAQAYEVMRSELVSSAYQVALAGVTNQQRRVEALVVATAAALNVLIRPTPPLYGTLGFSLEQSILTPQLVDNLYQSTQGAVSDLLAALARSPDRLSDWPSADPDGEDIAGVCLDFARRRCAALDQVAIEPLLLHSLGEEPRQRSEALQALAASASPFLGWDEARLRSNEHHLLHECVVLGLPPGASTTASGDLASPLLEGLGEILWAQVIVSGDRHRVTALCAVHGLPLTVLAGLDEYAAAYNAATSGGLHVFEDWTLRLDLLVPGQKPDLDGQTVLPIIRQDTSVSLPPDAEQRKQDHEHILPE